MKKTAVAWSALLLCAAACGTTTGRAGDGGAADRPPGNEGGAVVDVGADVRTDAGVDVATDAPGGETACWVLEQHPNEGGQHVNECSATQYGSNPPSSGGHYPRWPVYKTYDQPVPWGFLVHGLEHGAVVISYNCPDGCAADVARAQALIDAQPLELVCADRKRIILAPDPTLTIRFAAAAWTWTLRADCFDEEAFGRFITEHYGRGPEAVCGLGIDLSATRWCP